MIRNKHALWWGALMAAAGICSAQAQTPAYYSGRVTSIEVWKTGNVAFTMYVNGPSGIPCNGQLVLNKSDPGFKNQYAALVAAKLADQPIRVYVGGCIPAEGYGSSYAEVSYLYLE